MEPRMFGGMLAGGRSLEQYTLVVQSIEQLCDLGHVS